MTAWNYLPHAQILTWKRDGFWADCLISDRLDQHARKAPDQIAFVDSRQSISYSQLQKLTWRIALSLQDRGLKRGDVVAIQLPNWIEFPALYVAVVRLGAVASLIPPMCRENEVAMMLKLSNAKWYV
ncbi:MAG: AMP-binding protein, partial [Burkholderiaceae bacterium]